MASQKTRSALALAGFVAATLLVGGIGAWLAAPALHTWYPGLRKPPFTPPGAVFGPVWTVLYILMAVAAWLAWRTRVSTCRTSGLRLWWAQLAVNLAWTVVFFRLHGPGMALLDLGFLLFAVVGVIRPFRTIRPLAAGLLAPYAAWLVFATYLNAGVWWLNR